jgi:Cys-tRNA(Pro)/Cys-tRNA(Cys) deacylase
MLTQRGVPFDLHTYDHDPRETSFGAEAARKLNVEASHVFKTIIFLLGGRHPVAAIVPVTGTVDPKALARALDVKRVDDCPVSTAERLTGYVAGGMSPLGHKTPSRIVVDESALALAHMYVSGGRRGLEIRLSPVDLIQITGARTAQIAQSSARVSRRPTPMP